MMKLALMRTATGRPRVTSAAEDKFPASEFAAQINASEISSNRHISTSTVQWRQRESGLHGRIAAKKPLLKYTINNKRLAWAKKHKQCTSDQWKSVLWSDESKFEIFDSNLCVFVRRRVREGMFSACVVPTGKHGGGDGVGVLLLVTLLVIYLEFKAHLTSMATTTFCSDTPSHLVWA